MFHKYRTHIYNSADVSCLFQHSLNVRLEPNDRRTFLRFPSAVVGLEDSVATFRGNEFFSYNLSQTPIQSSLDEITLSFRTLQRNGLLLHTGKSADYVNLSLRNGALWLVINLGSGAFEALVEPSSGKFNDNVWHDVRVTRNLRQVRTQLWLYFLSSC